MTWIDRIERIRSALAAKRNIDSLTPDELANTLGCSRQTIWYWLNGRIPSLKFQTIIARKERRLKINKEN